MLQELVNHINYLDKQDWSELDNFDGWSGREIRVYAHQITCDEFDKEYDDEKFEELFYKAWNQVQGRE